MTDATNVTPETYEWSKGEVVQVGEAVSGNNDYWRWAVPGEEYEIRRVYKNSVLLRGRFAPNKEAASFHNLETYPRDVSVNKADLLIPGVKFRPLGTPPEGEDVIEPDDPRIAWFFEDAARLATREGQCGTYDRMMEQLGAPGRERQFKVSTKVNGFNATVYVRAHSRKEALALVGVEDGTVEAGD